MRFPHNEPLALHQVRGVRSTLRVTAGAIVRAVPTTRADAPEGTIA